MKQTKLHSILAILILAILPLLSLTGCGDKEDDEPETLNAAEQKLVGSWVEDKSATDLIFNGAEVGMFIFREDKTGVYSAMKEGTVLTSKGYDFTWSATERALTVKKTSGSATTYTYRMTSSHLYLESGGKEVVYRSVN